MSASPDVSVSPDVNVSSDMGVSPNVAVLAPVRPAVTATRRPRHGLWSTRGLIGVTLVALVVLAGAVGPLFAPYGPNAQSATATLVGPSAAHWLGTDELGRDVLSRMLYGIRIDLIVVFVAAPAGAATGTLIGLLSTRSAVTDTIAQRFFDVVLAFPALILAITLTAILGAGVLTVSLVIGIAEMPVFGRLIRTSVLTVRELPYVESSRVIGASGWWVLRKHILPNSLEPLIVQLAISMSMAVFIEGAMSFLGIGVKPPTPSLGALIQTGMQNIYQSHLLVVGPLVVICMLTLGFLLISQALSSARRG